MIVDQIYQRNTKNNKLKTSFYVIYVFSQLKQILQLVKTTKQTVKSMKQNVSV